MKLKLLTGYFALLILTVSLSGCGGETTYTTRVTNFSKDTLGVQFYHIYDSEPELIFLTPGISFTLFVTEEEKGSEAIPDCSRELDSVTVVVFSGKTLFKDFMNPDDWNHRMISTKGGRFVEHFCDFGIYTSDLHF